MTRKISSVAFLALFFVACATPRALNVNAGVNSGVKKEGASAPSGDGYAADGYTVIVLKRDSKGKPTYIKGAVVTCEASNPSRGIVKITDSEGRAQFSIRGKASFWVDYESHVYTVPSSTENSDTVPNQGFIEFDLTEARR